ncbi:Small glutamine-rich tetratricopeptide repeat-containing protein 2 [Armadillidium nasatum]|uniref:Small glutamine-rich tetratricopeptide repeat-containing protein 2 n=1 Tax=Armadillidium nasatum TaxID=96803 RepID=A0A5N5T3D8_9CRUS|nr:Small glutamine-rich tetratricopeptide repeat-containing protein 2 [Armadillidium nasatum]
MALRDALTQFNTLVNTLSHASGKGVHEILQKKLMNPHYDVVDKEEEILLNVNFNNISIHPVNLIEVNIQSLSVEVKVRDLADTDHFLKISRLHEEIDVNKSKYEIVKDSIRMTLVKLKRGKWHCLHYHHPDVFKNFKDKVKAAKKHIPIIKHLNLRKDYEDSHPEALKFYEKKEEKKEKKKTQNEKKAETLKLNGNQFVKKKEYFEAIQSYTEAIDLDPQCPIYYLNRAIAYYNICFYVLALEDTAKALSINPFYCKAYYYLGETLLHDCFPDDALKAFQRALILDPLNRKIEDKITETYEFRHHFLMFIECIRHCDERETLDMVMRREKHLKGILKVMDSSVAAERLFKHYM